MAWFAIGFVAITIIALVIAPLVMVRRLDNLRQGSVERSGAATPLVNRLRVLVAEEVIQRLAFGSVGDSAALVRVRAARDEEEQIMSRLAKLAPLVGRATKERFDDLRRDLNEWHRYTDVGPNGTVASNTPGISGPDIRLLRATVWAANDSLVSAIERSEAERQALGEIAVRQQRVVSVILGLLAIAALSVLGLLGRRQRKLANELASTVDELNVRILAEHRARAEAESAVATRERVLGIVSHDLKNPLHTMKGALELATEATTMPEMRTKALGMISRAIARMQRLVMDLLDVARLESGHSLAINPKPVVVSDVLGEAEEIFRAPTTEKDIHLSVVGPGNGERVVADHDRMLQVLENLIGNAVKFTPSGGRILVRATTGRPFTHIEVVNSGPGIQPEVLLHLFRPFWQATSTASKGSGLGLSITKGIVEAHGGTISVESEVDKETRFSITVPTA